MKQAKHIFKFKQFEVDQTGCAMKINTDGVLLAAMVNQPEPRTILDIGTGTGVIALMLAQRFPNATIDAVEIDESAAKTAENNFRNSIYTDRLSINNIAIQQFNNSGQFDLIVSNPPYFVNDLKNTEEKKGIARHTDQLFFNELLDKVNAILSVNGTFWFILPVKQAEMMVQNAEKKNLFLFKTIHLHSDANKPEFRRVVGLGRAKIAQPISERFNIYKAEKVYTDGYVNLLKNFFLRLE